VRLTGLSKRPSDERSKLGADSGIVVNPEAPCRVKPGLTTAIRYGDFKHVAAGQFHQNFKKVAVTDSNPLYLNSMKSR